MSLLCDKASEDDLHKFDPEYRRGSSLGGFLFLVVLFAVVAGLVGLFGCLRWPGQDHNEPRYPATGTSGSSTNR